MTTLKSRTVDSGTTEVECTGCCWTYPAGDHLGHGTPERPGGADYIDAAMPLIGQHIATTGHAVRVTSTTYHRDGRVERSDLLVKPRVPPGRT